MSDTNKTRAHTSEFQRSQCERMYISHCYHYKQSIQSCRQNVVVEDLLVAGR